MSEPAKKSNGQKVVFRIDKESYGINIFLVQEIIKLCNITPAHRGTRDVQGIINLRGTTIRIFDLAYALGLQLGPETEETRIMVVESGGASTGLIVDEVAEVVSVDLQSIEPAPPLVSRMAENAIEGIAKTEFGLVTLLNLDLVLAA